MNTLYAYDFDGTLTTRDTLPLFIASAKGWPCTLLSFALFAPLVVLMKLRFVDNSRLKERLFGWHFKGMRESDFLRHCQHFADTHRHLLRTVPQSPPVIVTASIDSWVQPFFPDVEVIGTQVEVYDGHLTGRFSTPNCYGAEKVRRLLQAHPDRGNYRLVAYGDSRGDRELLQEADEAHWV